MRHALWAVVLLAAAGCTQVNTVRLPGGGGGRGDLFVTTGDIKEPYESLGLIQSTRRYVIWFGFWDPAGTDLDDGLNDLVPEARAMGGDGIINLRFEQTQYPTLGRILAMITLITPLPSEVTYTGEVVRFGSGPKVPMPPPSTSPVPPGGPTRL